MLACCFEMASRVILQRPRSEAAKIVAEPSAQTSKNSKSDLRFSSPGGEDKGEGELPSGEAANIKPYSLFKLTPSP